MNDGIPGTSNEEACDWFLHQFKLDYVILTAGSQFSTIFSHTGESSTIPTPHVSVVDTVGAGDCFSGTFTITLLKGANLHDAHRAAVNAAAFVCTQHGAWPEYPEVMPDFLAESGYSDGKQ